jgi:hypothetical protein
MRGAKNARSKSSKGDADHSITEPIAQSSRARFDTAGIPKDRSAELFQVSPNHTATFAVNLEVRSRSSWLHALHRNVDEHRCHTRTIHPSFLHNLCADSVTGCIG